IFFTVAAIAVLFVLLLSLCVHLITGVEYFYVLRVFTCFGIPFVLLIGFGAAHTIKAVTASVTFQDKKTFLSRLNVLLAEIGYHPESQTESFLTYKPSLLAGLFSGKISVQIDDTSSTIVGPNAYIKKLQKRLQQ
ncbi:MAG: hypothetical protein KKH28_11225, partial [Elusimicrobia bacterium]|nr:hypothetical protein [Elusimicrobiota bacterium]